VVVEILNVHDYPRGLPPNTIRIGRPSVWGNPYNITEQRDRAACIVAFRAYSTRRLAREPDWLEPLRGKNLACYCAPLACHGDVLMELLYGRA
jgi:hypothetical protein